MKPLATHPCLTKLGKPGALVTLGALCASLLACTAARANDFPTADRVLYVQECMRAHPGPPFEMTHKCSCVLDGLATELKFDDYVTLSTLDKAMSIGGERGGSIRDAPSLEAQAKRYRELRAKTEASCFIGAGPR